VLDVARREGVADERAQSTVFRPVAVEQCVAERPEEWRDPRLAQASGVTGVADVFDEPLVIAQDWTASS
jgi:hypothetical protein